MTLGEWLNQMIMEDGPEPEPAPQPARRRFDAAASSEPQRPAPVQRLEANLAPDDDIERIADALDRLSARIEASEGRSTLAISGIDQSVVGVLSRLEMAERQQNQVAARFEGAVDEVRSDQATIGERLRELETARHGARSAEALKGLENALTRVASHLYEGEGRTRDALEDIKRDVDGLARRVDQSNDPGGASALVDQVAARIAARLEQAEARTADALKSLEGSFAHLDERLGAAEQKIGQGDIAERRFETLAADLSHKVEQVREELADRLGTAADSRFDRMEGALAQMTGHVQAAEQRSAEAIERMGQDVVRMTEGLNQKLQSSEHRNAESIANVTGEMGRIASAVESRMKRADSTQAEALEKLGGEIARITERLAERIANAERRSAQSMDDVGEQVARVTERLQQRQERASSELIDRMRQSEERTAKLLDEAREKIDKGLGDAHRRLIDQVAAAPAPQAPNFAQHQAGPYADPYAAGPFTGGYAAGGEAFGGQAFGEQAFGGQDFPAFGGQAYTPPAPFEPDPLEASADYGPADPFAAAPTAPAFAPADIEAADDFAVAEPVEETDDDAGVTVAAAEDDTTASFGGFEAPEDFDVAPEEQVSATRSTSTRELIAQARAAARAASAPPEPKGRRAQKEAQKAVATAGAAKAALSSPLFSGFGIGRKKPEGNTMKTALLMSALAASVGIGAAGFVVMNGGAIAGWAGGSPQKDDAGAPGQVALTTDPAAAAPADPAPLDPRLALALSPSAATAPDAPPPEAQALYNSAFAQIEAGDTSGLEALRKAANLGYAPAQYYLAKLYEDGKGGIKKDLPEARRWTERAAANGEPRAMHNLATFYYYGEGGPQNAAAAADWFKKAANLGWVDSQFNLAVMNEKGLGVRQNPAEAYKWYIIAGRNGDEPSRTKAAELKKALSPAELSAAERAAQGFRAEAPNASAKATVLAAPGAAASVTMAQRALSRLGYYQGPMDGTESPALRLAIAAYQRDQGITASGALSPELVQRFATASR